MLRRHGPNKKATVKRSNCIDIGNDEDHDDEDTATLLLLTMRFNKSTGSEAEFQSTP